VSASATYGVDPCLTKAILLCESGFNPRARSRAGALGVGQLMPETARRLGVQNPFDPHECIWGTCAYLRRTIDYFHSMNMAILASSYNAGEEGVRCHLSKVMGTPKSVAPADLVRWVSASGLNLAATVPNNRETPHYVHDVLWAWDWIQKGENAVTAPRR
jgi:soluble lytic murein transglycosylase-like protein